MTKTEKQLEKLFKDMEHFITPRDEEKFKQFCKEKTTEKFIWVSLIVLTAIILGYSLCLLTKQAKAVKMTASVELSPTRACIENCYNKYK